MLFYVYENEIGYHNLSVEIDKRIIGIYGSAEENKHLLSINSFG